MGIHSRAKTGVPDFRNLGLELDLMNITSGVYPKWGRFWTGIIHLQWDIVERWVLRGLDTSLTQVPVFRTDLVLCMLPSQHVFNVLGFSHDVYFYIIWLNLMCTKHLITFTYFSVLGATQGAQRWTYTRIYSLQSPNYNLCVYNVILVHCWPISIKGMEVSLVIW